MTPIDRTLRIVLAGWAAFLLMALLVVLMRGTDHLANMAAFAVLGTAMPAWVALRRSKPSLVVSLVLGVLHTLQQIAYLVAGATGGEPDAGVLAVDAVGLLSGVLLVLGSAEALRQRRARRREEAVAVPGGEGRDEPAVR